MNPQSLSDLIARGEGFTTEFKRSMPSDLGREMCAFREIGELFVSQGVGDYGKTVAVKEGGGAVNGVRGNRFEGEHGISSVVGRV